jgi:hypothetical protein
MFANKIHKILTVSTVKSDSTGEIRIAIPQYPPPLPPTISTCVAPAASKSDVFLRFLDKIYK